MRDNETLIQDPSINQMKMKLTNLISSIGPKRSLGWRSNIHKHNPEELRQFRMDDYDTYVGLKQNIMNTFSVPGSKLEKDILLLNKNLNDSQVNRMKKVLEKLSIKAKAKDTPFETNNINTEFISKMYIIEKGKEKRRQLILSARKERKKRNEEPFFIYDVDHIKDFEKSYSPDQKQKSMPVRMRTKSRKESVDINFKPIRRNSKEIKPKQKKKQRNKQTTSLHPIVKIFDLQSSNILQKYKDSKEIDLMETQPYFDFDERIDSNDSRSRFLGLDLSRIQRHFEKIKSDRINSTFQMMRQ